MVPVVTVPAAVESTGIRLSHMARLLAEQKLWAPAIVTGSTTVADIHVPAWATLSCSVYLVLVAAGGRQEARQGPTAGAHETWNPAWLRAAVLAGERA